MESDHSGDDFVPITIKPWGEQSQQQQQRMLTTWSDDCGWRSLIIARNTVQEGCKGSGNLHRSGRNYKPLADNNINNNNVKITSISISNRNSNNNSNSSSNSNISSLPFPMKRDCPVSSQISRARNYDHDDTVSEQQTPNDYSALLPAAPPSPQPTVKDLPEISTPVSQPGSPAPERKSRPSIEPIFMDPDSSKQPTDHQIPKSEYCNSDWMEYVKDMTAANKHMLIGVGFDSNYSTQLGDKRKHQSLPLTDSQPQVYLANADDDHDLWRYINISIQRESNGILQQPKTKDWLSSGDDISPPACRSSTSSKGITNSSSSSNSSSNSNSNSSSNSSSNNNSNGSGSNPHKLRFANRNKQRYSIINKGNIDSYPQNYRQANNSRPTVQRKIAMPRHSKQ